MHNWYPQAPGHEDDDFLLATPPRLARDIALIRGIIRETQPERAEQILVERKDSAVIQDFLPVAVWYGGGRSRATMIKPPGPGAKEEWRRDLTAIKQCGFNAIKCWADWATGEPRPGEYRFETQELIMDLARELGLKVIIQLYLDSAPDWLAIRYPDARYVAAGGDAIDSKGSPGYCYDNPGVRQAAEAFMRELAGRVKGRQEFLGWDLWSEPHIVQWAYLDYLPQPALFCYCHHTVTRFREWLKAKYGTIEALNNAWYRTFTNWDAVDAPRFVSLMTHTDGIDWQKFILDKLAADLNWRMQTVKAVDPNHVASSHNDIPCLFTLPLYGHGSPDDWRMAKSIEIWGTSLYPKHVGARDTNDPGLRAAELDQIRSACAAAGNSGFWLGELQGGHGYVGMFAVEATAQDEVEWTWQSISYGAKGLCFYAWHPMSTGYESAGFGLANLDGSPSDRAKAAGAAGAIVNRHMDLFLVAKPPRAEVAILYNVYAHIMWTLMREKSSYIPSRSLLGAHRPMYERNIPADYIHLEQIEEGQLARYKVLYMPFSLMITRKAAAGIAEFVKAGGTVIAEARTAWNDETGACGESVPGFGLADVFGCRERAAYGRPFLSTLNEDDVVRLHVKAAFDRFPGLKPGDELMGYGVREILEVISPSAQVLATFDDGRPAIVANRYGNGLAIFIGTFLSFATETMRPRNNLEFLRGVALGAGIAQPIMVRSEAPEGMIEARVLQVESGTPAEEQILFVFNHHQAAVRAEISVAVAGSAVVVSGLNKPGETPAAVRDGYANLAVELSPGEIWVARVAGC